jgi:hypothetical protein
VTMRSTRRFSMDEGDLRELDAIMEVLRPHFRARNLWGLQPGPFASCLRPRPATSARGSLSPWPWPPGPASARGRR